MSSKPTSNGVVKVEFVCRNCKEGNHDCPRYWTGLGLEIWCICTCAVITDSQSKENIQDDIKYKWSDIWTVSKLEETEK